MRTLLILVCVLGCNRGPEPPADEPAPREAPETMEAERPANPHAGMAHAASPNMDPHAGLVPERPGGGAVAVTAESPQLAGIRWTVQEPLTWRAATRPMRNAEYVVTGDAGEAVMTVFHFPGMGGALRDNINRWAGQFTDDSGAPVRDPAIEEKTISGLEVTTVDVRGTFSGGMGGGAPEANSRMLAAIVVSPTGPIFFKLVGPESLVADAESAFNGLIESVEAVR